MIHAQAIAAIEPEIVKTRILISFTLMPARRAASALPTPDSWEWFSATGEARAPSWRKEVTLRSVEMFTEYEPGGYLPWISPTPLLLLVAVGDHLVPSELAIAAFDTAHQPKELIILPGGHFDAYVDGFEVAVRGGEVLAPYDVGRGQLLAQPHVISPLATLVVQFARTWKVP